MMTSSKLSFLIGKVSQNFVKWSGELINISLKIHPSGKINLMDATEIGVYNKVMNSFPYVLRIVTDGRTWFLCSQNYSHFENWVAVFRERTKRFVEVRTLFILLLIILRQTISLLF